MITQKSFYCQGCGKFISFQAPFPSDPKITNSMMETMGFTIFTEDGKEKIYCQKCKSKVPEQYRKKEDYWGCPL